jgi:hypothetical protein
MGGIGAAIRVFGGADALESRLASLNAAVFGSSAVATDDSPPHDYHDDATLP